jgi:hypothetical protein
VGFRNDFLFCDLFLNIVLYYIVIVYWFTEIYLVVYLGTAKNTVIFFECSRGKTRQNLQS